VREKEREKEETERSAVCEDAFSLLHPVVDITSFQEVAARE